MRTFANADERMLSRQSQPVFWAAICLTLPVVVGVDTHADTHVAAVFDQVGGVRVTASFPTTPAGCRRLLAWFRSHGKLVAVGRRGHRQVHHRHSVGRPRRKA